MSNTHILYPDQLTSRLVYGPMIGTEKQFVNFASRQMSDVAAGDLLVVRDPEYDGGARQVFRVAKIEPNSMNPEISFVHAERPHGKPDQISTAARTPQPAALIDRLDEFGDAA